MTSKSLGFLDLQGRPVPLDQEAEAVARRWSAEGADAGRVEILATVIARAAARGATGLDGLSAAASQFGLPEAVLGDIDRWAQACPVADALAACALFLLDVSEKMALALFAPELPGMLQRADRSGQDARQVGTARHLRG